MINPEPFEISRQRGLRGCLINGLDVHVTAPVLAAVVRGPGSRLSALPSAPFNRTDDGEQRPGPEYDLLEKKVEPSRPGRLFKA